MSLINPSWHPGDKIISPVDEMVDIDSIGVSQRDIYKLLIGGIVPRPIAFVSTVSPEGVGNLAPFSFFNGVSSNPPCVMISITRKNDGGKKDTLRNIETTGQFVVNTTSEWLAEPMNHCSADYPYGVDEMKKVGLTALPSSRVKPARVKESPVQFECEIYKTLEVGDGTVGSSTIVVGRVVMTHVWKEIYHDGRIDFAGLKSIARIGGNSYAFGMGTFELARPKIQD